MTETREITSRRFGHAFERPCQRPEIVECAMWECQVASICRYDYRWAGEYTSGMNSWGGRKGGENDSP